MQQTASYSITSSASASSVGGSVRPSAFAVLKLTESRKLVGRNTGNSTGLHHRECSRRRPRPVGILYGYQVRSSTGHQPGRTHVKNTLWE